MHEEFNKNNKTKEKEKAFLIMIKPLNGYKDNITTAIIIHRLVSKACGYNSTVMVVILMVIQFF